MCGVRQDTVEVLDVKRGQYSIMLNFRDKKKLIHWALVIVYGVAHEENKLYFLAEFVSLYNDIEVPYIVGCDFNILRHCYEKNSHASGWFNSIIHTLNLREIFMAGGNLPGLISNLALRLRN